MAFHQMSHLGNRPFAAILVGSIAVLVGAQSAVLLALAPRPARARGGPWPTTIEPRRTRRRRPAHPGWIDAAVLDTDGVPAGRVCASPGRI